MKRHSASMPWASGRVLALAASATLLLSACGDVVETVLWPFVEDDASESQSDEPRGASLPPPPTEMVDPLDPDAGEEVAETVENPNANLGAPDGGTPFVDMPENETVPVNDEAAPAEPAPTEPDAEAGETEGETTDAGEIETEPPAAPAIEPSFQYFPAGSLIAGSGQGSPETMVFVPDLVFPIKEAPAHPQSQVYRYGGGVKGGDQCDPRNFTAPWRDNYCESRSNSSTTAYCSSKGIHLGQDIRVGTPDGCNAERATPAAERERYVIVAVEDGYISNVGSYSVNLRGDGRIYRYLHPNMAKLKVAMGQQVKKGDIIGYVSNDFGGTPTTLHLHFEIKVNTAEHGWQYVPPYTSLLAAYQRRESNPGEEVEATANIASTP